MTSLIDDIVASSRVLENHPAAHISDILSASIVSTS